MSWFNKHNVQALFFGTEFESSKACGKPARLCLSSFQPSRCLLDSDSSWAAIIRVTVPHVTLTGTAWPLAVDRTDALVSAANSLTPIKRNLVCILTHLQGAKVQLLFGHCVCCFFFPFLFGHVEFSENVALCWCWSHVHSLSWLPCLYSVWKHIEKYFFKYPVSNVSYFCNVSAFHFVERYTNFVWFFQLTTG